MPECIKISNRILLTSSCPKYPRVNARRAGGGQPLCSARCCGRSKDRNEPILDICRRQSTMAKFKDAATDLAIELVGCLSIKLYGVMLVAWSLRGGHN